MAKSKGRLLAELLASDGKVKESKSALDIAGGKLSPSDIPTLPNSKLENSSISIAGHSTSLGGSVTLNTGDIGEHTNYKYYTDARVRAAISASGDLSYNSSTGVISFSASASPVISVNSATGSVVLDTGDISENGNLYHTTARARGAISATGSLSYNSTTGVISFTMPAQNTSNITEGSNKYYTDARVGSYLSTNGYATQSTIIGAITDSAPATLDTLNELAAALGDDANFSTTVTNSIGTKWTQDNTKISQWNTAYGWGNHASAGYVTSSGNTVIGTDTDLSFSGANVLSTIALTDGVITSYTNRVLTLANLGYTGETNATADQTAAEILTAIKTVDGSGSGLDADTVDGVQASRIVYGDNATATNSISGAALNPSGHLKSGFYRVASSNSTIPNATSVNFVLHTSYNAEGNTAGFDLAANDSTTSKFYLRPATGGGRGAWQTIWTSSSDGAGSGLDADLLDGQHGSYYYSSANPPPTYTKYLRSDVADSATGRITFNGNATNDHDTIATASGSQGGLEVFNTVSGNDAFMAFHAGGDYALYFGLDADSNKLAVGGWSMGANKYAIYHEGNKPSLATLGYTGATNANYITNNNQLTNGSAYLTAAGSITESHRVSGSAFATTGSPGSVLEYQQASGQTDTKLAPSTDWYNTIRMGHGNPYSYYSSTIAMQMTGSGYGQIKTQSIQNNTAAGWRTQWDSGNDGAGSGLDADLLDGQHGSYYLAYGNLTGSPTIPTIPSNNVVEGGTSYSGEYPMVARTSAYTVYSHNGIKFNGAQNKLTVAGSVVINGGTSWHSGNDGSGSGLDADTLDGYQKSDINPAHSHYRWTGISASSTQARRFVIMRLYGCPSHWDSNWQDIHFKVWSESYEATNLKYQLTGDYNGGTQSTMFQLRLKDAGGSSEHGRFRLVLGTPVDAGWDHSGANTYYVDVYAEASHYMQFTVAADFYSAGFNVNTLPTSGGATSVVYSSPTVSNITTFNEAKEHSYFANHKIWNDGNHGSASGLDADLLDGQHASAFLGVSAKAADSNLLDGLDLHTGRNDQANKVVRTDANGYLNVGWINTTSGSRTTQAITRVYASDDSYLRYYTLANFGSQIASHINYNSLQNKPTIPSLSGYATETYVNNQITSLVDSSPAALNTLNELAAAIGDDANFSTTVTNNIATKLPLAGGTITGSITVRDNITVGNYSTTDTGSLLLTGSTANKQAVLKCTNGNLHMDGNSGNSMYLNYYTGGGIYFGTGAGGVAAVMGSDGDLWKGSADNTGNKYWHAGNDGSGSGLDADTLDGKSHENFGATLATYGTTSGTGGRIRCTAPFNTNSGHMFQVTVSLYTSYQVRNYVVAGYMYSTSNQWYSATAIYTGPGTPDIKVGRDSNGKAYISIARGSYTGVRVHNMTRGFYTSVADTYDPWTITENDATENSLTPTISTTWHSTNDGSGSGLDADLLDGQQGSYYAAASSIPTNNNQLTNGAGYITDGNTNWNNSYGFITASDSSITSKLPLAGGTITGNLNVNGTTTLGNGNADQTHINDTLYLGATDSGDSHFYFGENSSNWYGDHWYWDSGYEVERYSRYAGTDSLIEKHDTRYTHKVQTNRAYERLGHSTGYQIGSYNSVAANSTKTNPIYTIGDSYRPSDTSVSGMYGIGYAHSNLWGTGSGKTSGWGQYVVEAGAYTQIFSVGGTWSLGEFNRNGNKVWDAGNDGSGSGLDADTVDGKHKDFLMHYKGAVSGNWDTIFSQTDGHMGVYQVTNITNTDSNYPSGAYTYGGVMSWQLDDSTFKLYAPHTGQLHYQTGWNNDEYSGWRKIWDTGNDGSGSGLDADLLDGQHASAFLTAETLSSTNTVDVTGLKYFKTAGTMTSPLIGSSPSLQAYQTGGNYAAYMAFHRGGYYAINWGLDTNNAMVLGGWSSSTTVPRMLIGTNGLMVTAGQGNLWGASNDGSGSGLDADLLDGQQGSYYAPNSSLANYVLKGANTGLGAGFKMTFHSGSGGATFGASHYSMGVDVANGGWSGTNYSDLIIGYHTGIRIGAGYSGIRFYNNSPTTDANNDGNGDGGESLLMTIGGGGTTTSGANVTINNGLTVGGVIDANGGHGAINITNSSILSSASSNWTGNPGGAGKIQYHSNRWYIVSDSSSNRIVQFRRDGSDKSHIDNDGRFHGHVTGDVTGNVTGSSGSTTGNAATASAVSMSANRTDSTQYPIVWATTGSTSQLYSHSTTNIRSSDGTIFASHYRGSANVGGTGEASHHPAGIYSNGNNWLYGQIIMNSNPISGLTTINGGTPWHSGSDGSGSGLDADLLDGQQGSYYLPTTGKAADSNLLDGIDSTYFNRGDNGYGVMVGTSGWNMNDLFTNRNRAGFFDVWSGSNFPSGTSHVHGIQVRHNSSAHYGWQLAGQYGQNSLWHRQVANNSWGAWNQQWGSGNDGSGSGLDADTVDGIQGASIVKGGTARKSSQVSTFAGVNEVSGFYFGSGVSGAPTTDWINYMHAVGNSWSSSNNYSFQLTHAFHSDNLWVSRTTNGSQSTARKIWDSATDGAGSGLDADLLDGQQGSYYAPATGGSYLPLAGGTTSGTITLGTQYALVANNYGRGLFGVYSASRYQHVWSMGTAYKTSDDGTSYGNMYGLTYTHTNIGTGTNQSISGLSHQLQHRQNGVLNCAFGTGIWTSGNVTAYSDIAVKTNLVRIPNALEKVCSINGYTYERTDYIKDLEDPEAPDVLRQAGVVAQEIEKVLPEVVSGKDGNKAVAYGNIVALLIESIKELKDEVDELKKQLKER